MIIGTLNKSAKLRKQSSYKTIGRIIYNELNTRCRIETIVGLSGKIDCIESQIGANNLSGGKCRAVTMVACTRGIT